VLGSATPCNRVRREGQVQEQGSKIRPFAQGVEERVSPKPRRGTAPGVESPSLAGLGEIHDRAYDQTEVLGPLVRALRDDRVRTHGLRDGGAFVRVALTLRVGDDLSIPDVATEAGNRRRGLVSRLPRGGSSDCGESSGPKNGRRRERCVRGDPGLCCSTPVGSGLFLRRGRST
jgi:hypothetical protein